MNIKNLSALAGWLGIIQPKSFGMFNVLGGKDEVTITFSTADIKADLAGHAAILSIRSEMAEAGDNPAPVKLLAKDVRDRAQKWLDFTDEQADAFFCPGGLMSHFSYSKIEINDAIDVINDLIVQEEQAIADAAEANVELIEMPGFDIMAMWDLYQYGHQNQHVMDGLRSEWKHYQDEVKKAGFRDKLYCTETGGNKPPKPKPTVVGGGSPKKDPVVA